MDDLEKKEEAVNDGRKIRRLTEKDCDEIHDRHSALYRSANGCAKKRIMNRRGY